MLWSLVLAAGSGRRLSGVTGGTPKQFWRADGVRTLLEHTLDRSALVAAPTHTVVVVDRSHAGFVAALGPLRSRRLVYQPRDVGTAAGVLLGLTEILAIDPRATVVLMPADHGVRRPARFAAGIRGVARALPAGGPPVVLFGAVPVAADTQYGWIRPSAAPDADGMYRVARFVEKPPAPLARQLFDGGAVWNTMVLVARADALIALYARHLPALLNAFLPSVTLDPAARRRYLDQRYDTLPRADFSVDVLSQADGLALHVWPADTGWSDLGTPERLDAWDHARSCAQPVP